MIKEGDNMRIPSEVRLSVKQEQNKKFFDIATSRLADMPAVGFFSTKRCIGEDIIFDNRHIKVLPVKAIEDKKTKRTKFYIAIDVDKVELNSSLELKVPKYKKGFFIGTGAWQVAYWCKKLGLRHIDVVEL